jgi:colanic acid/amylovoran biosynthesis glycosyltransferase
VQGTSSAKQRLLVASRTLCLPDAEPDVCYIHNLVSASLLTFLHRLYPKTRICLYFHGGEVGGQPRIQNDRRVFDSVDTVITSTHFAAEQAVARGCDPARIAVVPLGFHLPSYAPSAGRPYRIGGQVRFISVGRMSPEKGFHHALKAVRLLLDQGHSGFTYTLVGSGIESGGLKSFAADQGLNDVVRFVGEKTRAEVAAALEQSDAFILPSVATKLWAETQATVVQEALLMGCLTLTTTAGGVTESNAPEMARFASAPEDSDALAARMREVLSLTAEEMSRLGAAGRAFAAAKYGIEPLMSRILAHALGELAPDDDSRFANAAR